MSQVRREEVEIDLNNEKDRELLVGVINGIGMKATVKTNTYGTEVVVSNCDPRIKTYGTEQIRIVPQVKKQTKQSNASKNKVGQGVSDKDQVAMSEFQVDLSPNSGENLKNFLKVKEKIVAHFKKQKYVDVAVKQFHWNQAEEKEDEKFLTIKLRKFE